MSSTLEVVQNHPLTASLTKALAILLPNASASLFENAKSILLLYVLLTHSLKAYRHLRARTVGGTVREFYKWLSQRLVFLYLRLPSNVQKVKSQLEQARSDIERRLIPQGPNVTRHLELPAEGQTLEWILAEMERMDKESPSHTKWAEGKLSGAVYHGGDDLTKVIVAAYSRYCVSNPLHPDVFPAVRKMEAEIVAMCLRLYNNPSGAGTMTSGGTESIVMAVKTYREWARKTKGITEPEMVIPTSAHAAFDKAAAYFKIKVHTIPVDPYTRKVDLKRVKNAINANTIMVVGSAVNFPDGNQDDIVGLGKLASKYRVGLHVDCCLGSFIMPYLERAGLSGGLDGKYKLEPFDFRVQGVTSISCDTHKYGFAPKGTSVIMYKCADLRKYQYYIFPDWPGGVYPSPSLSGSRPGALIAGCWAAMQHIGDSGYLASCKDIVSCARQIAETIRTTIPELYILGSPPASVVAFASKHPKVNVLDVGDRMSRKGWHLNALSGPAAVHIACTRLTLQVVDTFISDLKECIKDAKNSPTAGGTMVALYGLGKSSAVGPSMVGEVATAFIDTMYKA
ncbi:Dihydrosphingosine phosphate lyase [Marasmius crinis-equi]|uniref:sphinganine-1-phosphate aldolase n=1 Tax=Marasmius crinis-equi TaxID=585013 RepID=A0ABR3FJI6_9AGAR